MQRDNQNYKRGRYLVALKIVFAEMKKKRSLKPLTLLWKKTIYGDQQPFVLKTTLPEYIYFCRINGISVCIPNKELA